MMMWSRVAPVGAGIMAGLSENDKDGRQIAERPAHRAGLSPSKLSSHSSLRRDVLAVLHGQDDAGAVVEARAVLFGEVVDALAGGDLTLRQHPN